MSTVKMEVFIRYKKKALRSSLDSNFVLVNSSQMLLPTEPLELCIGTEHIDGTYLHGHSSNSQPGSLVGMESA